MLILVLTESQRSVFAYKVIQSIPDRAVVEPVCCRTRDDAVQLSLFREGAVLGSPFSEFYIRIHILRSVATSLLDLIRAGIKANDPIEVLRHVSGDDASPAA